MNRELWQKKKPSHTGELLRHKDESSTNIGIKIRQIMEQLATTIPHIWRNDFAWKTQNQIDNQLQRQVIHFPYINHLYVINTQGIQISSTYLSDGHHEPDDAGRNRSMRPYVKQLSLGENYSLSGVYINQGAGEPAVTVMQTIMDHRGALLGYLCAEFYIRHIPHSATIFNEPRQWQQIKGDPAIRSLLFQQKRRDSLLDQSIECVIDQLETLICFHGVFQLNLHFSSSRATAWFVDSPLHYRLLDHEMLTDPDLSFIYPPTDYPVESQIAQSDIRSILKLMQQLRNQDEVIYLRSASLNLFNGLISLTFSCDGTHYLHYQDLLNPEHHFWKQAS